MNVCVCERYDNSSYSILHIKFLFENNSLYKCRMNVVDFRKIWTIDISLNALENRCVFELIIRLCAVQQQLDWEYIGNSRNRRSARPPNSLFFSFKHKSVHRKELKAKFNNIKDVEKRKISFRVLIMLCECSDFQLIIHLGWRRCD